MHGVLQTGAVLLLHCKTTVQGALHANRHPFWVKAIESTVLFRAYVSHYGTRWAVEIDWKTIRGIDCCTLCTLQGPSYERFRRIGVSAWSMEHSNVMDIRLSAQNMAASAFWTSCFLLSVRHEGWGFLGFCSLSRSFTFLWLEGKHNIGLGY